MNILARGREAVILDAGPGVVLRTYLDGRDTTAEVLLHRHVADLGFPVPRLVSQEPGGMVIERVDGPTLIEALVQGEVSTAEVGAMLADLHRRLHALPAPPDLGGASLRAEAAGSLRADRTADRVLHQDLHPANVLLGADGPVVIDWASGAVGHPDTDLGHTALVLAAVVVVGGIDDGAGDVAALPVMVSAVNEVLAAFLAADHGGDPTTHLDEVVHRRVTYCGMSADVAMAAAEHVRALGS